MKLKRYKVGIWEELSGFIDVEADCSESAETLATKLLFNHGAEALFYPSLHTKGETGKHNGKHTHGNQEIVSCEEVA